MSGEQGTRVWALAAGGEGIASLFSAGMGHCQQLQNEGLS